ncbi:hypothetical protein GQ457_07G008030 [Hibiscus cannabinus]
MEKLVDLTGIRKQWVETQFRGKGGSDVIVSDRLRGRTTKEELLGKMGSHAEGPEIQYGPQQFVPVTRGLGLCEFFFEGDKTKKRISEIAIAWAYPYQAKLATSKITPDYQIWRTKRPKT